MKYQTYSQQVTSNALDNINYIGNVGSRNSSLSYTTEVPKPFLNYPKNYNTIRGASSLSTLTFFTGSLILQAFYYSNLKPSIDLILDDYNYGSLRDEIINYSQDFVKAHENLNSNTQAGVLLLIDKDGYAQVIFTGYVSQIFDESGVKYNIRISKKLSNEDFQTLERDIYEMVDRYNFENLSNDWFNSPDFNMIVPGPSGGTGPYYNPKERRLYCIV
ncbi:hypothetical protein EXU57_24300 [Segetibacter sp. 3557_3]|uniref:hypothetical protein n=1 Tax=Segetibacter sp. 3557_3 TaxID=2547429 RepID=UPI001058AF7E|nr:hypothetical protein [Segetibacter sp. 3557_3]TDH18175.1 hypothetical protein EXU57_24300 [Segetibacter sp. 3557_3]